MGSIFNLGEVVAIHGTAYTGEIISICVSQRVTPQYFLSYINTQGDLKEEWFYGDVLVSID